MRPNCVICGRMEGVKMFRDVRTFALIQMCEKCRRILESRGEGRYENSGRKPRYVDRSGLSWKQPVKGAREGGKRR